MTPLALVRGAIIDLPDGARPPLNQEDVMKHYKLSGAGRSSSLSSSFSDIAHNSFSVTIPRRKNGARRRTRCLGRGCQSPFAAALTAWATMSMPTASLQAARRRCTTGPGFPSPIGRRSTSVTGSTENDVPLKKHSSAVYRS